MANILVIDDEESALEYIEILLVDKHKVFTALDAVQGLACLRENEDIDLIISDLQMPPDTWGGLWLIEQVNSIKKEIPIIILSERGTVSKAVEAIKTGAKDYVEKNHIDTDLIPAVEKNLFYKNEKKRQNILKVSDYYPRLKNYLGKLWDILSDDTKKFLASSEGIYHEHSHDIEFDFSTALLQLTKAVEYECNNKIVPVLKEFNKVYSGGKVLIKNNKGEQVSLNSLTGNLTLGSLHYLINHQIMNDLCHHLNIKDSKKEQLKSLLKDLSRKYQRNEAAHSKVIDICTYEILRTEILGIDNKPSSLIILLDIHKKKVDYLGTKP